MNLTSTGDIGAQIAAGIDAMPDKIRGAFEDFVSLGPNRTLSALQRQYEETKETTETEDLPAVPTTRLPTLSDWSRKYNWLELAPLVWAQQGIAQRSIASATVDHGSLLAADTLVKLLDATQAIVLRKDGNQKGSDVIEFVSDNRTRLEAAKTLLDRAGVSTTRVAIAERLSSTSRDGTHVQERSIEIEGQTSEDLMRQLHERLILQPR